MSKPENGRQAATPADLQAWVQAARSRRVSRKVASRVWNRATGRGSDCDGRRRDPHRPATPDDWLHQRTTTTGVTSWYLAQASRTYNGFGQTSVNGSQHTRFTIPEHQRTALLAKDWSSFTAIQITVPEPGPYPAENLAALAAALCHQSLVWDSRTRHPAPLRVAGCVDRNHTEYRGASLTEQGPSDEENADQP
ncbi:RNaseH domain-containing protein [Streptomyces sp. TLI_053]|uniref:RNaseH domain-containing protein n=1 Tax=Streptomyces sp. TLI_053 TaxID=1855352 RepID=UPI000B81B59A